MGNKKNPNRLITVTKKKLLELICEDRWNTTWMFITPKLAEYMMEYNETDEWHNRPSSRSNRARYGRSMLRRAWKLTGETIIFSREATLLNGQNRLKASINNKCSFPCLVVFGMDQEVFKYMDTGTIRTGSHIFAIEGIKSYSIMASATRQIKYYYEHGAIDNRARYDNDELLAYFLEHLEHRAIEDSKPFGNATYATKLVPQGLGVALHYIMAQKHRIDADIFMHGFATGENLRTGSPILLLRKTFFKAMGDEKGKMSDFTKAAYVVLAWNAVREGRNLRSLSWRTDQEPNAPFPKVC